MKGIQFNVLKKTLEKMGLDRDLCHTYLCPSSQATLPTSRQAGSCSETSQGVDGIDRASYNG